MTGIIRGDKDILSKGWKETLAGMVKP